MKGVEQQNIKKFCNFYVSDLHLSVMLLPFISNEINKDVEVTTIFEKYNKENFEEVLNRLNVKNKNEILNINWFNNEITKEETENMFRKNGLKNNTIIIGGNKEYINKKNEEIYNYIKEEKINFNNLKIINCYNVEEVSNEMPEIAKKYDGVLNTSGENLVVD